MKQLIALFILMCIASSCEQAKYLDEESMQDNPPNQESAPSQDDSPNEDSSSSSDSSVEQSQPAEEESSVNQDNPTDPSVEEGTPIENQTDYFSIGGSIPLLDDRDYGSAQSGGGDIYNDGEFRYVAVLATTRQTGKYYYSTYSLILYTFSRYSKKEEVLKTSLSQFYISYNDSSSSDKNYVRVFKRNGVLSILYLAKNRNLVLMEKINGNWRERSFLSGVQLFDVDKSSGTQIAYSDSEFFYYCSDLRYVECEKVDLMLDLQGLYPGIRLFHNSSGDPFITSMFWKDRQTNDSRPLFLYKGSDGWKGLMATAPTDTKQVVGALKSGDEIKVCFFKGNEVHYWKLDLNSYTLNSSYSVELPPYSFDRSCSPVWGNSGDFIVSSPDHLYSKAYRYTRHSVTYSELMGNRYHFYFMSDSNGIHSLYSIGNLFYKHYQL